MYRDKQELLSPAGDNDCLRAAVCGGADAVYFGASAFNARARAANFKGDDMRAAIDYCHSYGKKAYVTLNTAIKERELDSALSLAAEIHDAGANAVICADIGLISLIRQQLPALDVHISTQAGVHSLEGAELFADMGAPRVVLARELELGEIKRITSLSRAETEVFIHGALCVSVSGRCLFSSLVGGRSGNRGECAQPCRLHYENGKYLLSLKDLSLARHMQELCDAGVASFKIEGRLKSADYVYRVTSIYRKLLDECRDATDAEMLKLERIFSRGGFTDAYFTGRIGTSMNGIRGEQSEPKPPVPVMEEPKIPLTLNARIERGRPFSVSYTTSEGLGAAAEGQVPSEALSRPMSREDYLRPLAALGGTQFVLSKASITYDEGLMLPVSALKDARRRAIALLGGSYKTTRDHINVSYKPKTRGMQNAVRSAKFYNEKNVTELARRTFDVIFIKASRFDPAIANGAFLPEVTSDKSMKALTEELGRIKALGCEHILVSDAGQLAAARDAGFTSIHTDVGFNVYNTVSAERLISLGASRILASPELSLPAQRELGCAYAIYGRMPLMILKKCIGKELIGCNECKRGDGVFCFKDRKGVTFTGMRTDGHGSVIFNSVPTYVGDLPEAGSLRDVHFIFTLEDANETDRVIDAYLSRSSLGIPVRRIK